MKQYRVTYEPQLFHADDEQHAIEQYLGAFGLDDNGSTFVDPTVEEVDGIPEVEIIPQYEPVTGSHAGHHISYNEKCTVERKVIGLTSDGDVLIAPWEDANTHNIIDSFLWCETCNCPVTGEEIGASNHWEVNN